MFIVRVLGGLGNQMFCYAFYKALQRSGPAKLDLFEYSFPSLAHHNGFELERIFDVRCDFASTQDVIRLGNYTQGTLSHVHRNIVKAILPVVAFAGSEKTVRTWWRELSPRATYYRGESLKYAPEAMKMCGDVYFAGDWSTERYFSHLREELLADFSFILPSDSRNAAMAEKINGCASVGIHVRRGDYVGQSYLEVCDASYYQNAMKRILQQVDKPKFFIFSDDIAWCKNIFANDDAEYVDWNSGANSFIDMQLMSMCKHNIIANSTFSWWAAWLNRNPNKIVIAPRKWMNGNRLDYSNVVPEAWIKIEN